MKPTYKEQSEKIIQAYLRCEIRPYANCACFVGNLLNNTENWAYARHPRGYGRVTESYYILALGQEAITRNSNGLYSAEDIVELEYVFMATYTADSKGFLHIEDTYEIEEDALFAAMIAGLEKLKQIHISKGEVIEEEIILQKRTYEKVFC